MRTPLYTGQIPKGVHYREVPLYVYIKHALPKPSAKPTENASVSSKGLQRPLSLLQAIHCCLHGLTEEDDSDKVYEKLYELAADKVCILHVMESAGSRVSVELVDPDSGDETINSILMKTFHPVSTLAPQLPAVSGTHARMHTHTHMEAGGRQTE